ncbi:hypothetical protein [Pseudomonas aeruginosa]
MGGSAWTANEFPATFTIEPEHPEIYKGIAFDSLDLERRPYDFTVKAKLKGKNVSVVKIKNNEKLWDDILFKSPVKADKIEIEIEKGYRIVALASIMPIKKEFGLSTVVNQCNYRPVPISGSREVTYTFYDALDNNDSTSMPVHCDGWMIIPSSGMKEIAIKAAGYTGSKFKISQSDDLKSWRDTTVKSSPTEHTAKLNSKFTKIEFDRLTKEIKEITFR